MSKKHIEDCVRSSLDSYFRDLRGTEPDGMYAMLVRVVEKPLLDVVMTANRLVDGFGQAPHVQQFGADFLMIEPEYLPFDDADGQTGRDLFIQHGQILISRRQKHGADTDILKKACDEDLITFEADLVGD